MKLYIIRHGETEWNKEKKLQGQSDVPLNEYGRELAKITAEALKDVVFDEIYASPLIRALETARIIKAERNINVKTDDRLKEISFGVFEGVPSNELGEQFSNFFFAPECYVPAEDGESYEELCIRAGKFLEEVIYPLKNTDKTVLIVAHGATNKALMLHLNKITIKDFWKGEFQKNCCVNLYDITEDSCKVIMEAKVYYEGKTTNYLER